MNVADAIVEPEMLKISFINSWKKPAVGLKLKEQSSLFHTYEAQRKSIQYLDLKGIQYNQNKNTK